MHDKTGYDRENVISFALDANSFHITKQVLNCLQYLQ